jgi:hypothetical protein
VSDLRAFRRAGRRPRSADEVLNPSSRSLRRGRCAAASFPSAGRVMRCRAQAPSPPVLQARARHRLAQRRRFVLDHAQPGEISFSRESLMQTHGIISLMALERKVSYVSRNGANRAPDAGHLVFCAEYRRWDLNPHTHYRDRILSPARLPSSWYWKHVAAMLKVSVFKAVTIPPPAMRLVVALG